MYFRCMYIPSRRATLKIVFATIVAKIRYPNGTQLFCMRIKKLILCVILLVKKIGPILSTLIQLYNYITHKLQLCSTGSINSLLHQHSFLKETTSQKDLIENFRLLHPIFEIQNFQPFYRVTYWFVPQEYMSKSF